MKHYVKFVGANLKQPRSISYVLMGRKTPNDILKEVMDVVNWFCEDHKYNVQYCRFWNKGNQTWIDFGSHTEFFVVEPAIDLVNMK